MRIIEITEKVFHMPKMKNQKIRMINVAQILMEETDDNHSITTEEIIKRLSDIGIEANRHGIYDDIKAIQENMGIEIISEKK